MGSRGSFFFEKRELSRVSLSCVVLFVVSYVVHVHIGECVHRMSDGRISSL